MSNDSDIETRQTSFRRESVAECWDESIALMVGNHAETGFMRPEDFKPDRSRYQAMFDLGILSLFTVRIFGALIGYALFVVSIHLHYSDTIWALQDVLYVKPEHRGRTAIRFIRWQDDELAADGVDLCYRHVSERNDYSRTLLRMGYELGERGYIKRFA